MAETVHVRAGPGGYELERHFDLDDPYLSPPLKGSPSQAPGGSDQGDKAPTGGSRKKPREFHAVKVSPPLASCPLPSCALISRLHSPPGHSHRGRSN